MAETTISTHMGLPSASIARRICLSATALTTLAVAVALLWIGPTYTLLAPWDVVIHLDETWRIYSGQMPHQDFHNAVGFFTYYLSALGMHLVGPGLFSVVVGNVIFLALSTFLAAFVAYRRLNPLHGFLFTLFVILLSSALCQIGRPADLPGYVEVYNRYGWTLTCIFFLQAFIPPRPDVAPRSVIEGVVAGFTLTVIVFTKVSFGFFAAIALVVALFARSLWRDRNFMLALIAGGLTSTVAMYVVGGASLFNYAADVLSVVGAQDPHRRLGSLRAALKGGAIPAALLAVTWTLAVVVSFARGILNRRDAIRITITATVIGVSALLIASFNTGEQGEIPLFVVLGLYILTEVRIAGSTMNGQLQERWRYVAAIAIVWFGVAGPIMLRDAKSIWVGYQSRDYAGLAPAHQIFDSPSMRDFVIRHDAYWVTEYWETSQLPRRINDGLELMRRTVGPDSTILTLAFSNPFPFALELPAPRGTPIWFDYGLNYNEKVYPDAQKLFEDVGYIAIPIIRDTDGYLTGRKNVETLLKIYGPFLHDHYREVGRSTYWILLKRQDLASQLTPSNKAAVAGTKNALSIVRAKAKVE